MIDEARFNRDTLERMTGLRRRIKQELGVTIRLSEPDALEQLLELSRSSQDATLQALGKELAEIISPAIVPPVEPVMAQGAIASRQYHGRTERLVDIVHPPNQAPAGVRIYRGQVVRA
jgi:hypothetical protein